MIDMTAILIAVVAGVPATIAAIATIRARREARPSGAKTAGETLRSSAQTLEVIQAQQHTNVGEILDLHETVSRVEEKVDRINGHVDRLDAKTGRIDEKLDDHIEEMKIRVMEHDAMVQRLKTAEEQEE